MSNAINKQIKANSGGGGPRNLGSHSEVSNTTFKMTQPVQAIANMGEPLNYGGTALNKHEPGHEESTFDTVKNYVRNSRLNVRATRPNSDRTTESSRIFGPTDKEIAAAKLYREKNRKRQEKIDKIKAGNS